MMFLAALLAITICAIGAAIYTIGGLVRRSPWHIAIGLFLAFACFAAGRLLG